mmetsp:Transcript_37567/g.67666  ORF Transcript_37567/g.67666 Transcript_37567/m.67666 type:complete len:91 (-) Transcript_37567:170-442(-)
MKNPTATLLWNFLMITVPPTHSKSNTMDDHRLTKASVPPRDDMVYKAMNIWMMDMKRMKYHQPAINLRLLPSHSVTERKVVALDRAAPMV